MKTYKLILMKENGKKVGFIFEIVKPKTIFIDDNDVVEDAPSEELFEEMIKRLQTKIPPKKKTKK